MTLRRLGAPFAALIYVLALFPLLANRPEYPAILPALLGPLLHSLWLTGAVVAISVPVALALSLTVWGRPPILRSILLLMSLVLLVVDPSLLAVGLEILASRHMPDGITLVACHIMAAAGLACLILTARLDRLDRLVMRIAAAQGMSRSGALRRVVLPYIGWSLVTAELASACLPWVRLG